MESKREKGKTGLDLTADALKDRQSVRATFRLPPQIIELLSIAASQLGLKQKSLFDQLIEDRSVLDRVATEAHEYTPPPEDRRQKTYVISRGSLASLQQIADMHSLPRDLLVEVSIRRLMPVINAEQIKQKKRALLLQEMQQLLRRNDALQLKAKELLGEEDPVYRMIAATAGTCRKNVDEVISLVEKGKQMEQL